MHFTVKSSNTATPSVYWASPPESCNVSFFALIDRLVQRGSPARQIDARTCMQDSMTLHMCYVWVSHAQCSLCVPCR